MIVCGSPDSACASDSPRSSFGPCPSAFTSLSSSLNASAAEPAALANTISSAPATIRFQKPGGFGTSGNAEPPHAERLRHHVTKSTSACR